MHHLHNQTISLPVSERDLQLPAPFFHCIMTLIGMDYTFGQLGPAVLAVPSQILVHS